MTVNSRQGMMNCIWGGAMLKMYQLLECFISNQILWVAQQYSASSTTYNTYQSAGSGCKLPVPCTTSLSVYQPCQVILVAMAFRYEYTGRAYEPSIEFLVHVALGSLRYGEAIPERRGNPRNLVHQERGPKAVKRPTRLVKPVLYGAG